MTIRSTSPLTEEQVIEVLHMLDEGFSHRTIAEKFGVGRKVVSRIHTGETWREFSHHYAKEKPDQITIPLLGLSNDFCDLHDEITAVKNNFGLNYNQPIHWGWFESWDGLHSVVSDGYIIWESSDLVTYAQQLVLTGIKGEPVWADKAEELPSFECEDIMSMPVGGQYTVVSQDNGIVKLTRGDRCVYLQQKYVDIAKRMKLDIREVRQKCNLVYFTRLKPKSSLNPTHVVIACASTLEA
jgi:hypothetical protein